jgi:hypothetical protein
MFIRGNEEPDTNTAFTDTGLNMFEAVGAVYGNLPTCNRVRLDSLTYNPCEPVTEDKYTSFRVMCSGCIAHPAISPSDVTIEPDMLSVEADESQAKNPRDPVR